MRSLIASDWYRARKGGIVWIAAALVVVCLVVFLVDLPNMATFGFISASVPGSYITLCGFIAAFVCGLSAERDFGGMMRNRITTGATRAGVFWSQYIVNTLLVLLCGVVYLAVTLCVGSQIGYKDPAGLMNDILQGLPAIAAFTAMFSLLCVLWPFKHATVACLILMMALMMTSDVLLMSLMEPEMYRPQVYEYIAGGAEVQIPTEEIPNPNYVAEPTRSVYMFFNSFLPTGQAMQVQAMERMSFLPPYAALFCAAVLPISLFALKRRNLQ